MGRVLSILLAQVTPVCGTGQQLVHRQCFLVVLEYSSTVVAWQGCQVDGLESLCDCHVLLGWATVYCHVLLLLQAASRFPLRSGGEKFICRGF